MTLSCNNFSFSTTFVTLLLKLLNKTRSKLLLSNYLTSSFTLGACFHIIRVVSTTTSAMRTNNASSILYFHVFARIDVFQRHFNLNSHSWSGLLSLLMSTKTTTTKEVMEHTKWVMIWHFRLIYAWFSALIIFSSFFSITKNIICRWDVLKCFKSVFVIGIFVWMMFKRHFFESLLNFFLVWTPRNS